MNRFELQHGSGIQVWATARRVFCVAFFLLTFRVFKFFPGLENLDVIWGITLVAALFVFYLPVKAAHKGRFTHVELFIVLTIVVVPIYSATIAWARFGQPFVYGLLYARWIFYSAGSLLIIAAVQTKKLSIHDIEWALVCAAWVTLALYVTLNIFFDPQQFDQGNGNGLVRGGYSGNYQFIFNETFIIFGFFYYGLKGFREKSRTSYIAAFIFIAYSLIMTGGRAKILSMAIAFIYLAMKFGGRKKTVILVPKLLIGITTAIVLMFIALPSYMLIFWERLVAAVNVIVTWTPGEDISANQRISETALAFPYISDHYIIGNGGLSSQWHDGYSGVISGYFYPSDIGFVGVLFVFGILGSIYLLLQFGFAWRLARRIRRANLQCKLSDALIGFVIFFAIDSIATGYLAWRIEVSLTMLALLYLVSASGREERRLM